MYSAVWAPGRIPGTNAPDRFQVIGGILGIELDGRIEEAEKYDQCRVQDHVYRLSGPEICADRLQQTLRKARFGRLAEELGDSRRKHQDARGKNRRNHARHVDLEWQVSTLSRIHLPALAGVAHN